MLVFKFGGASVKSAEAVRNIVEILKRYHDEEIVVVVSAMGKTTNALEGIIEHYANGNSEELNLEYQKLREYHLNVLSGLFEDTHHRAYTAVEELFDELGVRLAKDPTLNYDYDYDQLICYGELLSTTIIGHFLNSSELSTRWMDIRRSLKTSNNWREAKVDWELSTELVNKHFAFNGERILITQGFLGSTINDQTTSLGREGSDYTAAILAYMLKAKSVTIWKDVPGVLNADPKYFDDTILLEKLSYLDAIELAYFGTSVIHPKTIKPLQNKNINLHVKSFMNPDAPGTIVGNLSYDKLIPSFIFKMDQVLIRISPLDFSFINENNLEEIFGIMNKHGMKINLMQNSAISFKMIVNNDKRKLRLVTDELEEKYKVAYQTGLELVTIRYFDQSTIDRVMINKELIMEQRGLQNIELLIRDLG
ncbi:MAG: aspartate kinase [Bacteroidia bacterium]|nr:MAG: aspartate kinase [Bacteroidia bacterium]